MNFETYSAAPLWVCGGYGGRNPYVKYGKYELYYITGTGSKYVNISTPELPELSVNNAYAYVKVSSS